MGNSSSREGRDASGQDAPGQEDPYPDASRSEREIYIQRHGRGSRHDVSFFGLGSSSDRHSANPEQRRETRQERDARKREKERTARLKERERSMREEGVDGGYLVTMGVYIGAEDFNKDVVRQLMIERRLAPFWRGLEDHSSSWTEPQIIAAARGRPIPAPDEVPPEDHSPSPFDMGSRPGQTSSIAITSQSLLRPDDGVSDSGPHSPGLTSSSVPTHTSSTPFRHRAKSIATSAFSKSTGTTAQEPTRQEMALPADPYVNGQRIEVYLYKETTDCPICFREYPPYLNRTRCCDQLICSECFVQIKRPDPHPPEHLDPNTAPPEPRDPLEDENQLVSEPSTCPFCKTPEFGVAYDPPPFRRGLAYFNNGLPSSLARTQSGMSSSSSLSNNSPGGTPGPRRRRGESLSANAPTVITTDMIRPDWAKKLGDARATAARRSAAATALHTAAFFPGGPGSSALGPLSRRRGRADTGDSGEAREMASTNFEQLMAALARQDQARGNQDLFPGRGSSRLRNTAQDFEQYMVAEAIRQSLADEEERRKKEEKQRAKEEKQRAKDEKKAAKSGRKSSLFTLSGNSSGALNENQPTSYPTAPPLSRDGSSDDSKGKAKALPQPADEGAASAALYRPTPLDVPTSTINTTGSQNQTSTPPEEAQSVNMAPWTSSQTMHPPSDTGTQLPNIAGIVDQDSVAASAPTPAAETQGRASNASSASAPFELPPYLAQGISRGDDLGRRRLKDSPGAKHGGDVSFHETDRAPAH